MHWKENFIYICFLQTVNRIDLCLIFECLSDETGCGGQHKPKNTEAGTQRTVSLPTFDNNDVSYKLQKG